MQVLQSLKRFGVEIRTKRIIAQIQVDQCAEVEECRVVDVAEIACVQVEVLQGWEMEECLLGVEMDWVSVEPELVEGSNRGKLIGVNVLKLIVAEIDVLQVSGAGESLWC